MKSIAAPLPKASQAGFSLLEAVVGVLVAVVMVSSIAVLGGSLIRHRANSDSSSAATSLAQRQLEALRAQPTPPAAGTYGPFSVDESGAATVGAPYRMTWTVTNDVPWTGAKELRVSATHNENPAVRAELATYYLPVGGVPTPTPTAASSPSPTGIVPTPSPTQPVVVPTPTAVASTPTPKKGKKN